MRSQPLALLAALAVVVGACGSTNLTPVPSSATPSRGSSSMATPTPVGATTAPVTAPPPTPIGSTVDAPICSPEHVAVDVTGNGATGSVLLVIRVTNRGAEPCALVGAPTLLGLRAGGGSLPLTYQPRPDPWPGDTPDLVAAPVELEPGTTAITRAIWRNWCLGPADVSTVWVGLGTDSIDTQADPTIQAPR